MDDLEEIEESIAEKCTNCVGYKSYRVRVKGFEVVHMWCITCGGSGLSRTQKPNWILYPTVSVTEQAPYLLVEHSHKLKDIECALADKCYYCEGSGLGYIELYWCRECGGSGLDRTRKTEIASQRWYPQVHKDCRPPYETEYADE